jgi:tRNA-2-methylthio-N6-dimethylallyladenosine synthase
MTDDVSEEDKKRRNNLLLATQNEVSERLLNARIGLSVEVLINGPSKKDPSRPSGRSGDHRTVILDSGSDVSAGDLVMARVHTASAVTLFARLEQKLDAPLDLVTVPPSSASASLTDALRGPAGDHSAIRGRRLPVVGR